MSKILSNIGHFFLNILPYFAILCFIVGGILVSYNKGRIDEHNYPTITTPVPPRTPPQVIQQDQNERAKIDHTERTRPTDDAVKCLRQRIGC
jgi:hypothetical protein